MFKRLVHTHHFSNANSKTTSSPHFSSPIFLAFFINSYNCPNCWSITQIQMSANLSIIINLPKTERQNSCKVGYIKIYHSSSPTLLDQAFHPSMCPPPKLAHIAAIPSETQSILKKNSVSIY